VSETLPQKPRLNRRDAAEIALGASAMAFPVAQPRRSGTWACHFRPARPPPPALKSGLGASHLLPSEASIRRSGGCPCCTGSSRLRLTLLISALILGASTSSALREPLVRTQAYDLVASPRASRRRLDGFSKS